MPDGMVKILFELDAADWHGGGAETLWAELLISHGRPVFRLANSPFCVKGISFRDIVRASPTKYEGVYEFGEVLERGGHSTFILLMKPDDARVTSYWQQLERAGCSYESTTERSSVGVRTLYSVDVPPAANLSEVFEILQAGLDDDVWLVQEGYAHRSD
jgi:hypothetical protein